MAWINGRTGIEVAPEAPPSPLKTVSNFILKPDRQRTMPIKRRSKSAIRDAFLAPGGPFYEIEQDFNEGLLLAHPGQHHAASSPEELIAAAARNTDAFRTLVTENFGEGGKACVERD